MITPTTFFWSPKAFHRELLFFCSAYCLLPSDCNMKSFTSHRCEWKTFETFFPFSKRNRKKAQWNASLCLCQQISGKVNFFMLAVSAFCLWGFILSLCGLDEKVFPLVSPARSLHYIIPLDGQLSHIITFSHLTHKLGRKLSIVYGKWLSTKWQTRTKKGRKCDKNGKIEKAKAGPGRWGEQIAFSIEWKPPIRRWKDGNMESNFPTLDPHFPFFDV